MAHHCHALLCKTVVKPELLMCLKHWKLVPKAMQVAVWRHYRAGQCDDKGPSAEWCKAADVAVKHVALQEKVDPAIILHGTETRGFLASFHPEAAQGGP